jgi:Flp pilus assembly pilin Flp
MQKFLSIVKDEKGQGMLEYIVAVGGIVLIAAAILAALKLGLVGTDGNSGASKTLTDRVTNIVSGSGTGLP